MARPAIAEPQVTIVVVPRECFGYTQKALESIYANSDIPFELVYVDAGSPAKARRYLEAEARKRNFHLIRADYYLSPNRARNLGLSQVRTKYVVFIDNDVVVARNWLKPLLDCAEETGAAIVGPLTCQGEPVHEVVHCAGGESGIVEEIKSGKIRRRIIEKIYRQGERVANVGQQLQRQESGLAEFHCMLVRTQTFDAVGPLDEGLLNTKEHVDFCIAVIQMGGRVYFEPASVVTYLAQPPRSWGDIAFYMLRWSDAWELASLYRLRDKWNLTEDDYFKNRYKNLGWRRKQSIIKPLSRMLTFGRNSKRVEEILAATDKVINRYLTARYAWRHATIHKSPPRQVTISISEEA